MPKSINASPSTLLLTAGLVLAVGIVLTALVIPSPSRAAANSAVVVLPGERIEQSSPAAADLNGNGYKEIVIGGRDGILHVVAYDGSSWSAVWSRQTAEDLNEAGAPSDGCVTTLTDIRSSAAIGDLNGDGQLEIVVTTGGDPGNHRNGGVLVYRYDYDWSFSLVRGWPQPKLDIVGAGLGASGPDGCWDGIWSSPTLGDLTGDGHLEIAVTGLDRRLHVWRHDGRYVEGWPIAPPAIFRGGWSSPAMADLDQDGTLEVIFATDNNRGDPPPYLLYAFKGDGSLLPGFPVEGSQNFQSSPAIGDIDGDGWLDIVVGTGAYESSGGNKVYAWDHRGNLLPGWPTTTRGNMPAAPALGDLTGDGRLEVVIGCGAEGDSYPAPCSELYVWHGDGSEVDGFPMNVGPNNPWDPEGPPNGLPYSPVLGDYDGDGLVEILAQSRWSWGVSTVEQINGTWKQNNDPSLRTNYALSGSTLIEDVDNDGRVEIVVGGAADQEGTTGALYIWKMRGNSDGALPWAMFRHDTSRTGVHGGDLQAPRLAFPEDITIFCETGLDEPCVRNVWVRNEGGGHIEWQIEHGDDRLSITPTRGYVTDTMSVQVAIDTRELAPGWDTLGEILVTGEFEGMMVPGSPAVATVRLYLGDVYRTFLPCALRNR